MKLFKILLSKGQKMPHLPKFNQNSNLTGTHKPIWAPLASYIIQKHVSLMSGEASRKTLQKNKSQGLKKAQERELIKDSIALKKKN